MGAVSFRTILTPNHYRLICYGALLAGAAGWNWYMLVNRDNWYQSPINQWGRIRPPLFDAFKGIMALYDKLDSSTLTKITDTAATFDPLQGSTARPGQDLLLSLYNGDLTDKAVAFYKDGVALWLYQS